MQRLGACSPSGALPGSGSCPRLHPPSPNSRDSGPCSAPLLNLPAAQTAMKVEEGVQQLQKAEKKQRQSAAFLCVVSMAGLRLLRGRTRQGCCLVWG